MNESFVEYFCRSALQMTPPFLFIRTLTDIPNDRLTMSVMDFSRHLLDTSSRLRIYMLETIYTWVILEVSRCIEAFPALPCMCPTVRPSRLIDTHLVSSSLFSSSLAPSGLVQRLLELSGSFKWLLASFRHVEHLGVGAGLAQ